MEKYISSVVDKKMPLKLKGKAYRMAVRAILLHDLECWPIKKL